MPFEDDLTEAKTAKDELVSNLKDTNDPDEEDTILTETTTAEFHKLIFVELLVL